MNIAFINICTRPYIDKAYFPTGLAYVVTAFKELGILFDIIDIDAHRYTDTQLEELLGKKDYKIIAFGALVSAYKYAISVAKIARKTNPNAIVIAGNSVASSIPEHLLTHTEVNIAVKGEGEKTFLNLINKINNGDPISEVKGIVFRDGDKIIDTGFEEVINDINTIPMPDWDLFDMKLYLKKSLQDVKEPCPMPKDTIKAFSVNTARGCPFRCTFCYHVFQYTKYRYRSPESILSEIDVLQKKYGVNYINFFDELTFFNKKQASDFADAVLASGLSFFWNADIRGNLFDEEDMELLHRLKNSGCLSFGYSLESGNTGILKSMNKKLTVGEFQRQKHALDKAGITTFTSLVLGYPQETLDTLKETFDVCYDLGIYPSAGYLLPQPGTLMFQVAQQKGLVTDMESFLMHMGDRQDLRFNLTNIPDDIFQREVAAHLKRISEKIGLGLKDEQLIKTFHQIVSQKS